MRRNKTHTGFTLVELLVVVAIIGILIAMLLPAVQSVRDAARRTHCMNNLRQIGLATIQFHDTNSAFPPARTTTGSEVFNLFRQSGADSWFVRIMPFIEQNNLHQKWDFNLKYEDQADEAVATPVSTFLCSSRHTVANAKAPDSSIIVSGGGG